MMGSTPIIHAVLLNIPPTSLVSTGRCLGLGLVEPLLEPDEQLGLYCQSPVEFSWASGIFSEPIS